MNLKGKRLLILGGSRISCEIVRHARKLGIVTGVTDWYEVEKSPAKQLADEAYLVNTTDMEAMSSLVKDKKFDGIITGFTDSVLPSYAEVCRLNGLPAYGTREQFEIFTDKEQYKELMRKFDVPTIPEYHIDLERFDETTEDIEYPVIVKPVDSSGSRGITVCGDKESLHQAIDLAISSSKANEIVVEKYIDSEEVTIFWLFVDGKYHMVLLGNRHIKHNQENELPLPVGYTYPSDVQPRFLRETAPKMEEMFRSVGIKDGFMFMQCKVVDGLCLVYDIGYRLTGSLEYINLKAACGFDPLDMLINFALTGKMDDGSFEGKADPYLGGKYAYNVSILFKPGKIAKINGLEEVKAMKGVIDAVVAHPVGDVITDAMKGRLAQITVRILGIADTVEQMKSEMLEITEKIAVFSDNGEKMNLQGIELSDFKYIYDQENKSK